MRRKDRSKAQETLTPSAKERLGEIVDAAERAARTVIDDAEEQARRYLAEAETEAKRLVAERLAALSELTDTLREQADAVRSHSERLVEELEDAKRELRGETGRRGSPSRVSHLTAVDPPEDREARAADRVPAGAEREAPAGARLLATQMAVSGSSREEIEQRLRNGFEIEDTAAILDAILGPED